MIRIKLKAVLAEKGIKQKDLVEMTGKNNRDCSRGKKTYRSDNNTVYFLMEV